MIKQIQHLAYAAALLVFIAFSIAPVQERVQALREEREFVDNSQGGEVAGETETAPVDTAASKYPPLVDSAPSVSASSSVPQVSALDITTPAVAQSSQTPLFARWAIVVSLFVVTSMSAIIVGLIAFFVLRYQRRYATPYITYRKDMRAYLDQAEAHLEEQRVLRNIVMREGEGQPEVDPRRRFG
ncbi:MAG: hypothetical protein JXA10_08120 [Anaerolineae bacterium]|nr:hypothetical protein [Anaerolineae bacterium]